MAYECYLNENNMKMIIRGSDYVITGIKDNDEAPNDEVKAAMYEWSTMLKGKVKGLGFSEVISHAFISDKAEKKSSKKDKEDKETTPPVEAANTTVDTAKSPDPTPAHAPAVTVSTQEESIVTTDIDTDAPFWD